MDPKTILAQMTLEEKAALCSGRDFWRTKAIERLGLPSAMMCDGPHGLRKQISEGDHLGFRESIETVCYPTASALASSFDRDVLDRLGEALGQECQAEDIAMLLGPGLNMKRSPLCGRNFEYFSEDPFLTGQMAAAKVRGVQSQNIVACPKHFATNNKETNRRYCDSVVSERALREIYLRGFEICVKEARPKMIMTAYNPINGVHASENAELLSGILRQEWGYDGMVTSDWVNEKDHVKEIKAGNDIKMPRGEQEKLLEALQNGTLRREELAVCVKRILEMFLWLE